MVDEIGICTIRRQSLKFGTYWMGLNGTDSFWAGQNVVSVTSKVVNAINMTYI